MSKGAAGAPNAPGPGDGAAGAGDGASGSDGLVGGAGPSPGPIPGLDPGRAVIHRLNNFEYDNTIHDLLGLEAWARATFQPDEEGEFDNDGEAFTMNDARYEQYFNSAGTLAAAALTDLGARARIFVCAPTTDPMCFARIVRTFGGRAWRRPLTDDEVAHFASLADALAAAGRSADDVMTAVVQAMLSSSSFLYRIEWDPDPASLTPHPVGPYELASRLSYWLWSTMPDDELFGVADTGALTKPAVLLSQLDRMLDDPRSQAFVESFAGQWLGVRDLVAHQVEPTAFPDWDEALRAAMAEEMKLYFTAFLSETRPFDRFPNTDLNFVNARLARHYGMDATGLGAVPVQVTNTRDARKGYVGLAGILTATSFSYRTDPRTRARWILSSLLCTPEPFPPDSHPGPSPASVMSAMTVREQIDDIVASGQTCATCHDVFEPLGLALENFDAIGRFRVQDDRGVPIVTPGSLADGARILDEPGLADSIAGDPRFVDCASKKALTYALGRDLGASDDPHLENIRDAWNGQGRTLRALLEDIVVNDTFRFRRGEVMP
jgi:hypothetical protein